MAIKSTGTTSEKSETAETTKEQPQCGIIMPISATSDYTENYWSSVLILISRAIEKAGFEPVPVWKDSPTDRLSERIIANVFRFPICVIDISGSNPNVMIELGLRLASKKPLVVIKNNQDRPPFDILDLKFEAYPVGLGMLEMEAFLDDIAQKIKDKHEASEKKEYVPFLNNIVVDVVTPGKRDVTENTYILERLEEVTNQLAYISRNARMAAAETNRRSFFVSSSQPEEATVNYSRPYILFNVPRPLTETQEHMLMNAVPAISAIIRLKGNGQPNYAAKHADDLLHAQGLMKPFELAVRRLGGELGVPNSIAMLL